MFDIFGLKHVFNTCGHFSCVNDDSGLSRTTHINYNSQFISKFTIDMNSMYWSPVSLNIDRSMAMKKISHPLTPERK